MMMYFDTKPQESVFEVQLKPASSANKAVMNDGSTRVFVDYLGAGFLSENEMVEKSTIWTKDLIGCFATVGYFGEFVFMTHADYRSVEPNLNALKEFQHNKSGEIYLIRGPENFKGVDGCYNAEFAEFQAGVGAIFKKSRIQVEHYHFTDLYSQTSDVSFTVGKKYHELKINTNFGMSKNIQVSF